MILKKADWELDFYSRPILETDGKKRWELLITSSEDLSGNPPFRWKKNCPANNVNSLWLTEALQEALEAATKEGWEKPLRLRCWRISMRTMINKAATSIGLDVIPSKRTYSLIEWLSQREKDVYPKEEGYLAGPLAPPITQIMNEAIPLPEAVRGDALSLSYLPIISLLEAKEWPIEFSGLLPIKEIKDETAVVPGLRLFSKSRSLALAAWLGGLEPVRLVIENNQLLLEAGQEDRWLVTDLKPNEAKNASQSFINSRENTSCLQFISVQSTPEEKKFAGFWMLKDLIDI